MSTPVRSRFVLHACLGTALAMAACNKPKDDGVVAPDGGKGTPKGDGAPVELAPVDQPSQLLPKGTAMLVTGTSVARAAEVLERDRLVAAFGPQYTSMRAVIVGSIGHDLLDPKAWPEVGLDPGGTVGFGVTNLADPRLVLFATVADRTKVIEFVRSIAGKNQVEMVEEPYGGASILRAKGDVDGVLILRDRLAVLVFDLAGSGGQKGSLATAKTIVTMDPNVSLAAAAGYRKATGGLRAADVVAFFDVAGMVAQANVRAEQRESEPGGNWAQDELARARKEGASPERLAELERQAEEVRQNEERWRRAAEGQRALAELVASGIEGVGLTATSKRGGPVLDGRVVAGPEAFVRRLFANREGAPALTTAMNGTPLWCASGRIDPAAGYELAQAFLVADGKEPSALGPEGKRVLGLDVEADLVPVLAGDAEICLAIEGAPGKAPVDPKQLGFGAIVRATDAAKAKYVLAKVATSGSELGGRMKKKGEGYTVDVDDWRTVHVQTAGDRMVIGTDADLAKRLAAGDPGSMPSKIRPQAAMGALGLQGTAASQAFDLSLGLVWTMMGRSSMGESVVVAPGFTQEEMEKVPHSAKSKKAKKAMDKAKAKVEALEDKRQAVEVEQVMAITDGLGILVTAATEDDRGFTLTGGQFLRVDSLGGVIEVMAKGLLAGGPSLPPEDQKASEEAWQRYSDAQNAYNSARLEDASKAAKKLGMAPVVVPEITPAPSE